MAFTLTKLEQGNTLIAEIEELDAEITKLDALEVIWNDLPNDRYTSFLIFKVQELNRDTTTTEVEADEDTVTTLLDCLDTTRTYLQTTRDTKWAEFEALDQ